MQSPIAILSHGTYKSFHRRHGPMWGRGRSRNHRIVGAPFLGHQCAELDSFDDGEWRRALAVQSAKLAMAALLMLVAAANSTVAADPWVTGLWQKIDEPTSKSVGWFLFTESDGIYQGMIAKLFLRPGDPPNQTCTACKDDRKDQPLLGIPLIRNMKANGLYYEGGNILDPRDGNIYNAMMTLSPDGQTLTVRGYLGIALFGRDASWYRLPDTAYKDLDPIIIARYLPGMTTTASIKHKQNQNQTTAKSSNLAR